MEGVGSRLGRASSRYGPSTVFSGPVRKWKKQWVHISPSPSSSSTVSYQNNKTSRSINNYASSLLLRRWTPISPKNAAGSDTNSVEPEEPPRRKFRYTPIAVLEEQKKEAAEKVDDRYKTSRTYSFTVERTCNTEGAYVEEIQTTNKNRLTQHHSSMSRLNLDLGLKGHDENLGSDTEDKEAKLDGVRSDGIWA